MPFDSLIYAKEKKKEFLSSLLKDKELPRRKSAIFMASSPGAGKTEMAYLLAQTFGPSFIVIDADQFRSQFPGYNGQNSCEFQRGASYLVDVAFSKVLHEGLSFILDGTFGHAKAEQNIERVLKRNYHTKIYFVYQEPRHAWCFTKIREKKEGRNVPCHAFINSYLKARENINQIKDRYGDQVILNVAFKNFEQVVVDFAMNVESLDEVLPKQLLKEELEALIHEPVSD